MYWLERDWKITEESFILGGHIPAKEGTCTEVCTLVSEHRLPQGNSGGLTSWLGSAMSLVTEPLWVMGIGRVRAAPA